MLLGVLGDIHGNIDALHAVHSQLLELGVQHIVCCGDVVGYGGAPGECIDFMRTHGIPCACGNHDFYTLHPEHIAVGVREEAREVFAWTRRQLTAEQLDWLGHLPLYLESPEWRVCHSSCVPFPSWSYVLDEELAGLHFLFQERPLCFSAHSHVPVMAVHHPSQWPKLSKLEPDIEQKLPDDADVMIGVGAVGQPRDGDNRACAVIYDSEARTIVLIRVDYDVRTAKQRIMKAGLPRSLATRLDVGR